MAKMPKKKKVKDLTPKRINYRKYVRYLFFALILFLVAGSIRAFATNAKLNSGENQQQTVQKDTTGNNLAVSDGAQAFAVDFTRHYLRWDRENEDERADRLEEFLREGVDAQAGLIFGELNGNSKPDKVTVIAVKETGKDTSTITVEASHLIDQKPEGSDAVKTVGSTKYINIPIITDGTGYLVNGIPTLTAAPQKPKMEPIEKASITSSNDKYTAQIKKSLGTFLKVYATGTNEELSYYTNDKNIHVLNSNVEFQNIDNIVTKKLKKEKYEVVADAIFKDKQTNGTFKQHYDLVMLKKDGRWLVETIKK